MFFIYAFFALFICTMFHLLPDSVLLLLAQLGVISYIVLGLLALGATLSEEFKRK
jgi:uncharacterized membrane protein YeiB